MSSNDKEIEMESESGSLLYDRAKNHFLGQFPEFLPIEYAYIHIGMFLGWMLEHDLYSEMFEEEEFHQVIRFKARELSCALLSALWDGELGEDFFNEEGNAFAQHYYQTGTYHQDYKEVLAAKLPSIYEVKDSWENYEKIAERIEQRYQDWKDEEETTERAEMEENEERLEENEEKMEENEERLEENEEKIEEREEKVEEREEQTNLSKQEQEDKNFE